MKHKTKKLTFAYLITFALNSQAALLTGVDWVEGSADQMLTLDSRTGLEWLDLTETTNQSIDSILHGYGNWVMNGFRYATKSEVLSLLESAEVNVSTYYPDGGLIKGDGVGATKLGALVELIGLTYINTPPQFTTYGLYGDESLDGLSLLDSGESYFSGIPGQQYDVVVPNVGQVSNQNFHDPNVGSFLVRNVALIPEPSVISLFSIGSFCLWFCVRNKYNFSKLILLADFM